MIWQMEVTPEQAQLLSDLGKNVELAKVTLESTEQQFRLASEAMFTGHVPSGRVVGVDVATATVDIEVADAPSV